MGTDGIRIGLVQQGSPPGKTEDNLERSVVASRAAFEREADLVVLPELVVSGYALEGWRNVLAASEPIPGPSTEAWTAVCRETGGWICGGVCERDGDAVYDSAVVVGPDGVLLTYRKTHLFGKEKIAFRPGDVGYPVVDLPFGRVGVLVCYDLRFPEAVRLLALRGVDLICLPTAWVTGFDSQDYDEAGLPPQARTALVLANLNQVFIAAASQVGEHGGYRFLGASLIADPTGSAACGPASTSAEDVLVADVALDEAKRSQTRAELISPRADRRTDLYSIRYEGRDL